MAKNTDRSEASETTASPPARPKGTRRTRTARPSAGADTFGSRPDASAGMPHEESMVESRSESASAMSRHVDPSEEEIRNRAYLRYLERGGGHGMDFEDWVQAEKELKLKT
jgi:hypothetical protein